MTITTFEAFGFAEPLNRALTQCGYATPTPIQVQALPPQLEGRDLLGMAETGSGKTATFVLPILQRIALKPADIGSKQVRILILAPTRELAVQIDQEVASLSRNMRLRHAVILGGVGKGGQIAALKRGVDVLVATPGRLLDLVAMRVCDLSRVEMLVLDEADRMFDMGFIRDIRKIVSLIPEKRQTALFSATMPAEIKKFAYEILNEPYRIDLSTKTMVVDRIDQKIMIVRAPDKQSRLHTILGDAACERVIVFTRTKRGADRVADRLAKAGISSSAFHGNKAQNARQRALNDFMRGAIRVLVATDIAARGIDVSNITHVVNFDMPLDPETYVHRVGRTARKGNSGVAISLCDPSERQEILAIEKLMKQKLEVIADVGGVDLPPPDRHERHVDPRARQHNGDRRERHHGNNNGARNDRARRDHRPQSDAAPVERESRPAHHAEQRPERRPERRHEQRPEQHHERRPHRHAASAIEGEAIFGVGERRPSHGGKPGHGGIRGHGGKDAHRGERQSHHAHHPRRSNNGGDKRHHDREAGPTDQAAKPMREPNHGASQNRGEGRGSSWGGGNAPNFMKRGGGNRSRPRSPRHPAA